MLDAVRRYLKERAEDIEVDMQEENANKDDLQKRHEKLQGEVTIKSSWDDFGLDEFDKVEVLLEVEQSFDPFIMPDEEADQLNGVQETIQYMEKKLSTGGGGGK